MSKSFSIVSFCSVRPLHLGLDEISMEIAPFLPSLCLSAHTAQVASRQDFTTPGTANYSLQGHNSSGYKAIFHHQTHCSLPVTGPPIQGDTSVPIRRSPSR